MITNVLLHYRTSYKWPQKLKNRWKAKKSILDTTLYLYKRKTTNVPTIDNHKYNHEKPKTRFVVIALEHLERCSVWDLTLVSVAPESALEYLERKNIRCSHEHRPAGCPFQAWCNSNMTVPTRNLFDWNYKIVILEFFALWKNIHRKNVQ